MNSDPPRSSPAARGRLRGERTVVNRQRQVPVRPASLRAFLERASRLVFSAGAGVTVCLVSDREIARWNRRYRGKPGPTDVLSFPMAEARRASNRIRLPGDSAASLERGDIAISPAAARRNARALGRGLDRELRVLILHGLLHLAGYDHETDRGQMERREMLLRRRLGIG
ncbi:MAG TPA: rRNA maturation RNase YbeY [Candidatus Binatia bacterium]|nr:rRNA maturation RNase YbeY [Candidatus Binatia bacterium]